MTVADPFLFLGYSEVRKEIVALVWTRRNIENTTEDVCDFEPNQAKGHVGKALPLLREFCHVGIDVDVVDVQRLQKLAPQHISGLLTNHFCVKLSFDNRWIAAMIFRRACIQDADLPPQSPSHLNVERF